jgi:thiamine-phosphate pyrophosphorylase
VSDSTLRGRLRLYLVLDPDAVSGGPVAVARVALASGVTMLQLRCKHRTDRETLELAVPLRMTCRRLGIPFILNDRLDLALACDADGVHLGVDDLPLSAARSLSAPGFIIGYSPEHDEQIANAAANGATYLGIGPVFSTSTKKDAGAALGLTEFARRRDLTRLPVVGIGGIGPGNAASVLAAGADGIAVVSAIVGQPDPAAATRNLLAATSR